MERWDRGLEAGWVAAMEADMVHLQSSSLIWPGALLSRLKVGSLSMFRDSLPKTHTLTVQHTPSAFDRVHRLGQRKEVFVHRAVVEGTVEQRILDLQDVRVLPSRVTLSQHALMCHSPRLQLEMSTHSASKVSRGRCARGCTSLG